MDKNEKKQVNNPRQGANILSVITFKWLFKTFFTGFRRELEVTDLYTALDEHSSRQLGNKMTRLWKNEEERCKKSKEKPIPSLLRVLVKCFGGGIMVFGLCLGIVEFGIRASQPILLAQLLRYFSQGSDNRDMSQTEAVYWGTGMVIGVFLDSLISHPSFQGLMHMGMKIRVACCSLIYRKILKVSKVATQGETSIGQMINLLSNDVNRLDYCVYTLHYAWIAPIQTILVSYLLYRELGNAAFAGIVTLLIFLPIYGCYGKLVSNLTLKIAQRTDERLRLTNEIISGVKVLKMYAWEKPFSALVDYARRKEAKVIRNNFTAAEACWSLENYIPRLCIFVTILFYILDGHNVDAIKAYLITAYYNVLRTTVYRSLPLSVEELAEALVSIKRLQKFLLFEEIQNEPMQNNDRIIFDSQNSVALSFKNITAKWKVESEHEALRQINCQIKSGSLTAIIGQVGAGKTTLFHTILKEIPVVDGIMTINGKISYSSQEPWLFTSSVKQNIVFGQPMDKERYDKVIEVCQLKRDFQLLPYGENTLVGERGHNLSGGQCARINLARAVYHHADIYLLDDPLSAVDTHVGKGIFEECVKTFLHDKTVVLITHQFHYLKHVDNMIILENGSIVGQGTYAELINSGLNLTKMMQKDSESDEIVDEVETTEVKPNDFIAESAKINQEEEEQAESRQVGQISAKTYKQYFASTGSVFLIASVVILSFASEIPSTGADYFVTYWMNVEERNDTFVDIDENDPLRGRGMYIYIYGSLIAATIVITLIQIFSFFEMCMRISRNLHAYMFGSIVNTSMGFFNANPIGRIMNRFSKDMGIIDTRLPQTLFAVTVIFLYVIVVLGMFMYVHVWFIGPTIVLAVLTYFFRTFYIKTSRSIKRLEGVTRSPVFNHLTASVYGLSTIRALGAEKILIKEFDNHQDLHSSAWFIFFSGSMAFGMYIDLLLAVFIGVVVYTLLFLSDTLAGDVGYVITQCLLLIGMVQWGVRQTTELENHMTSVERILDYSRLPRERSLERTPENAAPEGWPLRGQIILKNVSLTYDRQEKPALNNLNFTVEPHEMIGIVGRTGAGKSSIINALFRLADLDGEIYIDGIATSKIALQDLRSKISIIPQEPVLFAGTLRSNLDPFKEYSDDDLWRVLEDVELKGSIDSDAGLQMMITEGGSNFSVGQRQLLCLARAIVRNHKILVLDEATANVDPRTDELIQKAVRKKFNNCTVLIIAHRLNTVMDSSKILVMDAGRVVEYDHPYNLLRKKDGVFHGMVQQTGGSTADNLLEIAKSTYEEKNNVETIRL